MVNNNEPVIVHEYTSHKNLYILLLVVLMLTILVGVTWVFGKTYLFKALGVSDNQVVQDHGLNEPPPKTPIYGQIYLTATVDRIPSIHYINFTDKELTLKQISGQLKLTAYPDFNDKTQPSAVYFTAASSMSASEEDSVGLHRYNFDTNTVNYFTGAAGSVARDPDWSEGADLLAFYRYVGDTPQSSEDTMNINDYEVVLFNPAENEVVETIPAAVHPHWLPGSNKLLFEKSDGLYMYDREITSIVKVLGLEREGVSINSSANFDISGDGKYIVLTTPGSGGITVAEVTSAEPFSLEVKGQIKDPHTGYYFPTFSPDFTTHSYAVEALDISTDSDGNTTLSNPRLEIRGILSREVSIVYRLDKFDYKTLFIDDWIAPVLNF